MSQLVRQERASMLFHLAVFAAGLAAGFLNVMAGGGSLLTLPVLIFLGLPVAVANGTNRFAILVQNVAAVGSFRRQGYSDAGAGLRFAVATVPGAIAGAWLAVGIDETTFRTILAAVLVLAVVGLLVPTRRGATPGARARLAALLAFFAIGFYGGFIQAGVGFLLMLVLHQLLGLDLVRTNMHKVLIVMVFSLPALAVFVATGNVAWTTAGALALGNASGAVVGARRPGGGGGAASRRAGWGATHSYRGRHRVDLDGGSPRLHLDSTTLAVSCGPPANGPRAA